MARMAHVLDEFVAVGKVLTCHEIDQRVEPLWSACVLSGITTKPVGAGEVFYPQCIEPLVRMSEILTGKSGSTHLVPSCDFFTSPLALDPDQAACFLLKRKFRIPNRPGTMPVAGMSAPVTIAGTVTVALAELLAGWTLGYVLDPTLETGGIVCTGTLDFRTMMACFASPEAFLQNASVTNIAQRLYGIGVSSVNGYPDCKRPGLEATFQKMLSLLSAPLGTAMHLQNEGILSAGQDYSPVQHLLDAEMNSAVRRFWGHYEISDETIALDLIERVMGQDHTNFLDTDHTTEHFRCEQWYPHWLDRSAWQGTDWELQAEDKMLRRIAQYSKEAIARYEKPDIDRSRLAELKRVFLATEKQIVGRNIAPLD